MQGRGIHYDANGNEYQGMWEKGVREGTGQQTYLNSDAGNSSGDVFEGCWIQDNRLERWLRVASYHTLSCRTSTVAHIDHQAVLCLANHLCGNAPDTGTK